jgi:hypothetical protein
MKFSEYCEQNATTNVKFTLNIYPVKKCLPERRYLAQTRGSKVYLERRFGMRHSAWYVGAKYGTCRNVELVCCMTFGALVAA